MTKEERFEKVVEYKLDRTYWVIVAIIILILFGALVGIFMSCDLGIRSAMAAWCIALGFFILFMVWVAFLKRKVYWRRVK